MCCASREIGKPSGTCTLSSNSNSKNLSCRNVVARLDLVAALLESSELCHTAQSKLFRSLIDWLLLPELYRGLMPVLDSIGEMDTISEMKLDMRLT